ncbi:MAG: hypothetical protein Q9181_005970 [Wetmoreana brouardii]
MELGGCSRLGFIWRGDRSAILQTPAAVTERLLCMISALPCAEQGILKNKKLRQAQVKYWCVGTWAHSSWRVEKMIKSTTRLCETRINPPGGTSTVPNCTVQSPQPMPARLSSMELSDPAIPHASSSPNDATTRRKSGRVKQKPVLLQSDPNALMANSGAKRKRAATYEDHDGNGLESEESSPDESDGDPDEEELKEKRRKSRAKKASAKPAAKKPKTSRPKTTTLPVRPAVNGLKKPSKPRQPRTRPNAAIAHDATGLFSEIFAQGHTVDLVAAEWITRYDQHNANAMCELVNFVLKCTGCDLQVDVHDIEDPDNAPSKLEDLQEEYQAQNITDYPLISKAKAYASFRSTMTGFFFSLLSTAHAAGVLYSDLALIENIEVWVTTMSSSAIRPFRHTATVISLTMESALCAVHSDLADTNAKTLRQKEGEQKKKTINKQRVASLQDKVADGERKMGLVDSMLENIFNAVYVHRYRDVDPKIRLDCVTAMGGWITTAPDKFFASNYLRYLGWVLSDVSAPNRAEVVRQLSKLYKNKEDVGRLRAFTEKFRPRFVEMAIQDAEPSVRAAAIEMLDLVREIGLLEPDDIDNVGRLIFDSIPKVRKAVAGFFAENITDLYESVVEELGGDEAMAEAVGEESPEDFDVPQKAWLMFKCLAEVLQLYSSGDDEESAEPALPEATPTTIGPGVGSRFSLAAQAVCERVSNLEDWESLAGFLLFDNSLATSNGHETETAESLFRKRCQLDQSEELILLEVLTEAVKHRLLQAVDPETENQGRKSKARAEEALEIQETVALHLAQYLPRLLRKFGANPATAAIILRLEHVLNLEIFEELRQDSTTYASLLDDISKQFVTHADQGVLAEASNALLHARSFEDLEEITESKVQALWSIQIQALMAHASRAKQGQLDLKSCCNTVSRIANLASISDCTSVLEAESRSSTSKNSTSRNTDSPVLVLTDLISDYYSSLDDEQSEDRDELIISSVKALLFYHMWLVRSLTTSIKANVPISNFPDYTFLASALLSVMRSRSSIDPVRLTAAGAYLDLHTLYASLRNVLPKSSDANDTPTTPPNKNTQRPKNDFDSLIRSVPTDAQSLLLTVFTKTEKDFARKSRRNLEPAPDDAIDSDPESDDEEDDEEETDERTKAQLLLAEKRLCELAGKMVLAVVGGVLDGKVKERLVRNRTRLGPNFKDVLAYLDEPKSGSKKSKAVKAKAAPKGGKKALSKEKAVEVSSAEESGNDDMNDEEIDNGELANDKIEDVDDAGGNKAQRREPEEEDEIMGD